VTGLAERRGIQSADKAIEVLLALVDAGHAAPLKELARLADMPTSLAHRYLASLIARGLAVQNPATGLYDLGPLAIRVGAAALARVDALALAAAAMPQLAIETGLTVMLNVLGDRGPTIVRWERSRVPFVTTLAVGAVLPLTGSASGRVILAFLPARVRDRLIQEFDGEAGDTEAKARRQALLQRFDEIRRTGLDTADSTVIPGLSAISAPVLDAQNEAVASLTLVGSGADVGRVQSAALEHLRRTAEQVSRSCGSTWTFAGAAGDA
jgi:DNA-binding IclR family transcriptional regulator